MLRCRSSGHTCLLSCWLAGWLASSAVVVVVVLVFVGGRGVLAAAAATTMRLRQIWRYGKASGRFFVIPSGRSASAVLGAELAWRDSVTSRRQSWRWRRTHNKSQLFSIETLSFRWSARSLCLVWLFVARELAGWLARLLVSSPRSPVGVNICAPTLTRRQATGQ